MGLAIQLVYEGRGGKPLLAATVEDPALIQQAVDLSVRQAFEEAQIVGEFDPLLGEVKKEEAERMEKVLRKLSQGNAADQAPLLAKPVDREPEAGELLFVDELAQRLEVKASWIYAKTRLKGKDQMPHTRIAGRLRFDYQEVLSWLKGHGA